VVHRLLIFHCGRSLVSSGRGPFFYCSKVEGYLEARLWNAIFSYAEDTLTLPSVR
jgi:malate synthase